METLNLAETMVLAAGATEYTDSLVSFAWIMGAALLAPFVSYMTGNRMPAVALLIIFGMILGPSVLDLAHGDPGIGMLKELGVGALFLLAGFEINLSSLRSKEAATATSTWLICLVMCVAGAWLITKDIPLAIVMAIAVTSTALGTITPMLKQEKLLGTRVGDSVMIHGAIGEVAPITAMALLLGTRSTWATALILLAFLVIAVVVAVMPRAISMLVPWVKKAFISGAGSTNQTILRLIVLILAILMAVTAVFELDIVLGAFAAGIILNQIIPDEFHKGLENRLDVLFYSMLIPVFFVVSGMSIKWDVIVDNPLKVLGIPILILFTRGVPVFLRENVHHTGSDIETTRERAQVALYAATGLPIIVAVTTLAVHSGIMSEEMSSIFIAGGALTVAIFPLLASLVGEKPNEENSEETPDPDTHADAGEGAEGGKEEQEGVSASSAEQIERDAERAAEYAQQLRDGQQPSS
ncbi:cation:proton antiporter [Corynebacterium lizhenjunii]|uniref:Cation:proton antiporter n=1 Tax=Corynebacterium lizhenjunii TaxID=2709394 RepID=A0A7T0KFF0_9CORY|nr:cation:proton antiporter [Corynebacterium lizhenjunii]QPK78979.1 cation:proton antiporter [Corynebacterium lizhenjunii]